MPARANRNRAYPFLSRMAVFLFIPAIIISIFFLWQSEFSFNSSYSILTIDQNGNNMIMSFHGVDRSGTVVILPANLQLKAARELGQYSLSNLYKLGEQQGIGGGKLLKESIGQSLYVPVDFYLYSDRPFNPKDYSDMGRFFQQTLAKSLIGKITTDLSLQDRIKLWYFCLQSGIKRWDLVDFRSYCQDSSTVPSHCQIPEKAMRDLAYLFGDQSIIKANLTIGVYNSSSCSQAGQKVSFLLNNLGAKAINITNMEEKVIDTQIWVKTEKGLPRRSYDRLSRLVIQTKFSPILKNFSQPVDMILIVGKNYCQLPD